MVRKPQNKANVVAKPKKQTSKPARPRAGYNEYLASLADPWTTTCRVPDDDTTPSAPIRSISTVERGVSSTTISGDHTLMMLIGPGLSQDWLRLDGVIAGANATLVDWENPGQFTLATVNANNTNAEFTATCSDIRPASCGLRVRYDGPAITASGTLIIAPCNPGLGPVNASGGFEDLFNGSVDRASQIAGAQTFSIPGLLAEGGYAESNWAPIGTSSMLYVESALPTAATAGNNAGLFEQIVGFVGTRWQRGDTLAAWPYWYVLARGLDTQAHFVIERVVNWEVHPKLAQFDMGARVSVSDPVAMAQAVNVSQMLTTPMNNTDMGYVRQAAVESAHELAVTRGTPKEHATVSGQTFGQKLKGLAAKAGSALLDNLPEIASGLLTML
jgi:hypothetical protein